MLSAKYDVTIAYRIYPRVSKSPFIHPDSKLKLTEAGIRTIRQSLGKVRAKFLFLLDNCPTEYTSMILNYFSPEDIIFFNYKRIGNLATFGKQIDLLLGQTHSEIVMFAEDDYVYRPHELAKAVALLKNHQSIDFVTPYDHLDSYLLPVHTRHRYEIISAEGLHWRTSASTCLTFLTTKTILRGTEKVFRSYCNGNWDSSLWFSLTKFNVLSLPSLPVFLRDGFIFKIILKSWLHNPFQILFGRKYKLWQPLPSIATHMEKISLAPGIDWTKVVSESEKN